MVKPYDGYGAGDRLYGYPTPPRAEESRRAIPPTSYYNVNVSQKPLQQPPRRFQSNDAAATKRTAHFPPGLNTSSSATVFTVSSLQQYTNSFSEEHIIGEGSLGNVYKAVFPHGKVWQCPLLLCTLIKIFLCYKKSLCDNVVSCGEEAEQYNQQNAEWRWLPQSSLKRFETETREHTWVSWLL